MENSKYPEPRNLTVENNIGRSDPTDQSENIQRERRLRASGSHRQLQSFQVAAIIYDATVSFCERFMEKHSRTIDQMVQAARISRHNVAETSRASSTSSQIELRMLNVARASLDELLLDYEDFLRQKHLPLWEKESTQASEVRETLEQYDQMDRSNPTNQSDDTFLHIFNLDNDDPAVVANTIICFIHQANYLLDNKITGLERQFITEDEYPENPAPTKHVAKQTDWPDAATPAPPVNGKPMVTRKPQKGPKPGKRY